MKWNKVEGYWSQKQSKLKIIVSRSNHPWRNFANSLHVTISFPFLTKQYIDQCKLVKSHQIPCNAMNHPIWRAASLRELKATVSFPKENMPGTSQTATSGQKMIKVPLQVYNFVPFALEHFCKLLPRYSMKLYALHRGKWRMSTSKEGAQRFKKKAPHNINWRHCFNFEKFPALRGFYI